MNTGAFVDDTFRRRYAERVGTEEVSMREDADVDLYRSRRALDSPRFHCKAVLVKAGTRGYRMRARADSAQATRERIVGAMVELLLDRWYDEVTLRDLAQAAGVALQTIVNHFSTKEGVLAATLEDPRLAAAFGGERYEVPADGSRPAVEMLVASYERAGDATIRLLALESRLPSLASLLAFGRDSHREWVQNTFPSALEGLTEAERERRIVLLITATDVYTWKLLRRDQGLTREQTAAAMLELVDALRGENAPSRASGRSHAGRTAPRSAP